MMELMGLANFQSVFIGIESPNEDSLIETKKLQNVRPKAGSLVERVSRIHDHGIDVLCGMIVGFDHDDTGTFDAILNFIDEAQIANALIGQPIRRRLISGASILCLSDARFDVALYRLPYWRRHHLARAVQLLGGYVKFLVIAARLFRQVNDAPLRSRYRKQLRHAVRELWRNPHMLFVYAMKTALHYHYAAMVRELALSETSGKGLPDAVRSFSRSKTRVPAQGLVREPS
jgi:hypothetical protein